MEDIIYMFLEKILEAVYFSLFLIIGKNIKKKKLLFIAIMIFEYLMLKHFIKFDVWFQLIYTFMSFVNLKVLYKEKAQITDIFLFAVASVFLIISSIVCYGLVYITVHKYIWVLIINRILIFGLLFLKRKAIRNKYKEFCSLWNRHNNPNKTRSLTIRNASVIAFNLMFWLLNICMIITYIY